MIVRPIVDLSTLTPVTQWGEANTKQDSREGQPVWGQTMFVRDSLAGELARKEDHTFEEYRNMVYVCGTHRSKSITLPVFYINWKRGVQFVLRNNFHDWGVSIAATKPVVWDFDDLGCTPDTVGSYREGFPKDVMFGSHTYNPQRFGVSFSADYYHLFAFVHLLIRQFPPIPAFVGEGI